MSSTKITTGKVRFSYVKVFEAEESNGGKEKFSVMVLIPKSDAKTVDSLKTLIDNVYKNNAHTFGGKLPAVWKNPLRDGDVERPDSPECEGMYFLNASTTIKPQVVDKDVSPIIDRSEFYSGCWGRVSLNFYAFNKDGNKGVGAGLNNLQKLEEGERLGGGSSAADDFGTVSMEDIL